MICLGTCSSCRCCLSASQGTAGRRCAAVPFFLRCHLRLVLSSLFPCLVPPSGSLPAAAGIVWLWSTSTEALGAAPECISMSFMYPCLGTPVLTHFLSRKDLLRDWRCVEPECQIITAASPVGSNKFVGSFGKLSQSSVRNSKRKHWESACCNQRNFVFLSTTGVEDPRNKTPC